MADDEAYLLDDREVVVTAHLAVRCDGGSPRLGHPIEYMTLERGRVVCGYCGRLYVHADDPEARQVRADGRPYRR